MAMETNSGLKTQSFMLSPDDIKTIDETKQDFGFTTKSEALRQIIQEGLSYRRLKEGIEGNVKQKMQLEIAEAVMKSLTKEFKDRVS